MLLALIFGAIVSSAHNGTRNFDECKSAEFKPKSCWESEQLQKAGKFGCQIQGKDYVGKAPGSNNGCEK